MRKERDRNCRSKCVCGSHPYAGKDPAKTFGICIYGIYLKGKSSLIIFERHAQLKYKYGNRKFWCKGYFVDTVGRNKKAIQEYIQQQMQEDMVEDQLTLFEEYDPFTGKKNKK